MSQNKSIIYVGLDVAKATFVVHWQNRCHKFTNDAAGQAGLLKLLTKPKGAKGAKGAREARKIKTKEPEGIVHVILEATGGYEQPIVAALHEAQLLVSVAMPNRVRAYAKALGRLAKTDPIDAALLSAFGEATQPLPTQPRSAREKELADLVRQRRQLVAIQTQLSNQAEHSRPPSVQKRHAQLQKELRKLIKECLAEILKLQAEDVDLHRRAQRLQEAHGVGPIVASVLLADMPELGSLSDEEAAALAGVAPYNCDSGPWQGSRRISGGRGSVRQALYMAAMTACRNDSILQRFYERLISKGKKKLVALTAVMRKLIVLLNRLLKHPEFKLQAA